MRMTTLFTTSSAAHDSMLVNVLKERQESLVDYIKKTYDNVTVFVSDNWMRLDFNEDGQVSVDDVRASLQKFYEFLKSYEYIENATKIKSQIYDEAKKYIRTEAGQKNLAADDSDISQPPQLEQTDAL